MNAIVVGDVLSAWLSQEVIDSREGRNKILDNHTDFASQFVTGDAAGTNIDTEKSRGHKNRFNQAMTLRLEPWAAEDNYFLGKIIHYSLMFVSGGRRRECMLTANNQEEYENLRFGSQNNPAPPTGINVHEAVQEELGWFAKSSPGLDLVIGRSKLLNNQIFDAQQEAVKAMLENGLQISDLTATDHVVEQTRERQRLGIALAVSHIALVAQERGGSLAEVPFLEPKSITDASRDPYYPFATI